VPDSDIDLWFKTTKDCSSAVTGSSVFDFNGDLAVQRRTSGLLAGPQSPNSREFSDRIHPVRVRSPDSAVIRGNRGSEGLLECPPGHPRPGEILEKRSWRYGRRIPDPGMHRPMHAGDRGPDLRLPAGASAAAAIASMYRGAIRAPMELSHLFRAPQALTRARRSRKRLLNRAAAAPGNPFFLEGVDICRPSGTIICAQL